MAKTSEVKAFYNTFVDHQKKIGISVRHRLILKSLKELKLTKKNAILEVGCGIGTVSKLIVQEFKNSKFVGCDISEQSIEFAKKFVDNANAEFICTDMSNFQHPLKFDLVVFPDVLEHIPRADHQALFKTISENCSSNCTWFINIPEPNALNYYRKEKPELLQIIDQSLSMQDLLNDIYPTGFQLVSMTPYSIHSTVNNYVKLVFSNNTEIQSISNRSKVSMLIQNILARF
jgi:2-polyprenyl-3-methyl-5-hydroxy-6-metoxy-1,4-benzoquinol methylase